MLVNSVRQGFATNSSSSHSVVVVKDVAKLKASDRREEEFCNFGWEDFLLTSADDKLRYLAVQLQLGLEPDVGRSCARMLVKSLLGVKLPPSVSIDHQSVLTMPRDYHDHKINLEFLRVLADFMARDDVVVVGGSDNGDITDYDSLVSKDSVRPLEALKQYCGSEGLVARKEGDWWLVFNRDTGTKARLSFVTSPSAFKPRAPELVDMKITDQCKNGNCDFCYQSSTPEGKHADSHVVERAANCLVEAQVFELALGGGEPSIHPDFETMLHCIDTERLALSFTTNSLEWLDSKSLVSTVNATCKGVAFSLVGRRPLDIMESALRSDLNRDLVHFNCVETITPVHNVDQALDLVNPQNVLLLGYKRSGRGATAGNRDVKAWRDSVPGWLECGVAVDTVMAAKHQKLLESLGAWRGSYEVVDGTRSWYYDAVNGVGGPNSYGAELQACEPESICSQFLKHQNRSAAMRSETKDKIGADVAVSLGPKAKTRTRRKTK